MLPLIDTEIALLQQTLDRTYRKDFTLPEYAVACYVFYELGRNEGAIHPAKEDLAKGSGIRMDIVESALSILSHTDLIRYQDLGQETVDIIAGLYDDSVVNEYVDDRYLYAMNFAWERLGSEQQIEELEVYRSVVDATVGSNQIWTTSVQPRSMWEAMGGDGPTVYRLIEKGFLMSRRGSGGEWFVALSGGYPLPCKAKFDEAFYLNN